jgi:DnaJ-class molecular chaperone
MTHYETLGVPDKATPDEIKKAYRRLASQHHPDKGGDTKKFQEIQTAYDVVSDANRRQQYDMERHVGTGNAGFQWHTGNIDDIFKNFGFGGGDPFGQFRHPQQRRNKDLRIDITVPLVTTLEDQTRLVSVSTSNGSRETLEVKIPRGINTGTSIKYSGLGDNLFNTLPRGDLYVQFTVAPAENFVVQGIDLYTKVVVNSLIAIVGGEATIKGLNGTEFLIEIPAGTQPGIKFRIPGQGLYQLNSIHRGNLYAEVVFVTPLVTPALAETIRSFINNSQ